MPSTTNLKRLYVRKCYEVIASSLHSGRNKVILTGTPGIGKSLFMIYLLRKLVKEGKRVLFVYHPSYHLLRWAGWRASSARVFTVDRRPNVLE